MSERSLVVRALKRSLRSRGLTYADVAGHLGLSLASVKRLFSRQDFTLERIDRICELIGASLRAILESESDAPAGRQLSLAQEQELVADPTLLFLTWLVANRTPIEEIVRLYRFTEAEVQRHLIRLDRLKVIELQQGNRVRMLVSRHFGWRPGGPVQRYIHQRLLREFLASPFDNPGEEFYFHGGRIAPATLEALGRTLRAAARDCADIMERDRSAPGPRRGAAYAIALRPWSYSGFAHHDRDEGCPQLTPGRGKRAA